MCPRLILTVAATAFLALYNNCNALPDDLTLPSLDFGLNLPACPSVSADLLTVFTVGSTNSAVLTRMESAALGCQLRGLLALADAGDRASAATLTAMYRAWRASYQPQVWHNPRDSQATWLSNLRAITDINTNLSQKYWASLNAYSDMSPAEFAQTVLMNIPANGLYNATIPTTTGSNGNGKGNGKGSGKGGRRLLANCLGCTFGGVPSYPPHVDLVAAGKVLPAVGFQARCASSWAFAAADAIESSLMVATSANTTTPLSPQHIMDCTANQFSYAVPGCTAGSPADALLFAAATGVTTDDAYRYRPSTGSGGNLAATGRLAQCDRAFLTGQAAKAGLVRVTGTPAYTTVAASKLSLIQALASKPAVALLAVDPTFQHYAGGVWSSFTCAGQPANHAMLLVGYSTEKAGFEHFFAKNSLGASWGENGYMRVAMTDDAAGMCGLYKSLVQAGAASQVAPTQPGSSDR